MFHVQKIGALLRQTACAAALACVMAPAASAGTFQFTYTGVFNATDLLTPSGGTASAFFNPTPFIATAVFSNSSPNLAPPIFPGFVAYSPISATLNVDGKIFNFATYTQNPTAGITVAVFDQNTPFGPGHYAAGFLQNPTQDGAGFIGDWLSATPGFSAAHLVPTVFTDYVGVGYGSGVDPHNGNPPAVTPIPLTNSSGHSYSLTLGNYDENFSQGGIQNTANIQAVPEASSVVSFGVLLALGLGGVLLARKKARE